MSMTELARTCLMTPPPDAFRHEMADGMNDGEARPQARAFRRAESRSADPVSAAVFSSLWSAWPLVPLSDIGLGSLASTVLLYETTRQAS
jgi:hypothetical protein